jgi:hypothetical protein
MSDKTDPKRSDLVPIKNHGLTTRSSALVKRGLENLTSQGSRIIRFPLNHSMGKLYISNHANFPLGLGEARGHIKVSQGIEVLLEVFTDALTDLSPLSELNANDLQGIRILDTQDLLRNEDLEHIKGLTGLVELYLASFSISDAALVHLQQLSKLKFLALLGPNITDAGMVSLQTLSGLERLNLNVCQISGAGSIHLRELKKLKSLRFWKLPMRDSDLVNFRDLVGLEELGLIDIRITDAGLVHLEKLTWLRKLSLEKTDISDSGIARLKQMLPQCSITN